MADEYLQNAAKPQGEFGAQVLAKMNEHHKELADWAFSQVTVAPDADTLDIGCGGGANLARLLATCPQGTATGVDYAATSVESSRALNAAAVDAGRCRVEQGDVAALPFPDASFDFAVACETVYFWPDLEAALAEVLPTMPKRMRVVAILSADEEIGSEGCSGVITKWAKQAFASLSFEPMRPGNTLVRQRKGVTAFQIACTGIRGHAGANYLKCASAIQQLCAVVNELYMLRDDEKLFSVNVGVIHGGTAENVVCDEATLRAEVRSFDPAAIDAAWAKIEAICAKPGIPGTTTTLKKSAAHPPFHANEKSAKLLELVYAQAQALGMIVAAEDTGGAGDVAFAAMEGLAALDGFGLLGENAHTTKECGSLASFERNVKLSAAVMRALFANPELVR